jgi:hypothetical protein
MKRTLPIAGHNNAMFMLAASSKIKRNIVTVAGVTAATTVTCIDKCSEIPDIAVA